MFHLVGVGNASGSACLLEGVPEVVFLDAGGRSFLTTQPMAPLNNWRGWAVLEPGLGDVPGPYQSSRPGQAAVGILWSNSCGEPAAAAVSLRFAADPEPIVARADPSSSLRGGRCDAPEHSSAASVWPVAPVSTPAPTAAQFVPPLAVRIDAPATAAPGQVLTYVVTLTNVSDRVVSFDDCPSYIESISGQPLPTLTPPPGKERGEPQGRIGHAKESYSLNCAGLRPLAPGGAIAFEMRIVVPADSLPGTTALWWHLVRLDGKVLLSDKPIGADVKLTIVP